MNLELKLRNYPVCPYCGIRLDRIPETEIECPNKCYDKILSEEDFKKRMVKKENLLLVYGSNPETVAIT
ncbi:MAG: hypothetical protein JEY91_11735 [Spirochaetaceae bacterium]|nr:hypothetical protein [Spirochaetaceae bacterium]